VLALVLPVADAIRNTKDDKVGSLHAIDGLMFRESAVRSDRKLKVQNGKEIDFLENNEKYAVGSI
jgi:hypothetical protein